MLQKIKLTQGKYAIIDSADCKLVAQYHWYFEHGYARCDIWKNNKKRSLYMHRLIMDAKSGQDIHHINHNRHDNRRCNLQVCTHLENCQSRKGLGYYWDKRVKKWRVQISRMGKRFHLGYFNTKYEAERRLLSYETH